MRFGKIGARRMMHHGPVLPLGARWVEYLESTGTQYIDTRVVRTTAGGPYKYEAEVSYANTATRQIMGTQGSFYFGVVNGYLQPGLFSVYTANVPVSVNTWYKCSFTYIPSDGKIEYVFGGSSGTVSNTFVNSPANATIWAFAANNATDLRGTNSLKYFRVYVQGILVRDFRPIAIGNTGYMLDLVSGEYLPYGNKGTGDFVIGPDKVTGGATDDKLHRIKLIRTPFLKARSRQQLHVTSFLAKRNRKEVAV